MRESCPQNTTAPPTDARLEAGREIKTLASVVRGPSVKWARDFG